MKGGVAVMVWLASRLATPNRDITWVFYDCEEIEATANGLGTPDRPPPRLVHRHRLGGLDDRADGALIEAGGQGTIRAEITTTGVAAHSARSWLGHNAIHDMADVLERVRSIEVGEVEVEGLVYREGLNATMISGGLAPNVVPDSCTVQVNYRFAPDKTAEQGLAKLSGWLADWELTVRDLSSAARPGLDRPAAADFVRAVGGQPRAKYGWTDVARFSELGIPAVTFSDPPTRARPTRWNDAAHCPTSKPAWPHCSAGSPADAICQHVRHGLGLCRVDRGRHRVRLRGVGGQAGPAGAPGGRPAGSGAAVRSPARTR